MSERQLAVSRVKGRSSAYRMRASSQAAKFFSSSWVRRVTWKRNWTILAERRRELESVVTCENTGPT